jgi:hypothetical protein
MSLAGDITTLSAADAESALHEVAPAVDFASLLLPEFTARGDGGQLFAGGLSTITIGGLIDRGDIYQAMQANPDLFGVDVATLNPDDLAETVWRLYTERAEAEAVINALAA